MTEARFLQIHSLHGYSAALLNRDDSGLAKRITYGGTTRTRISSQCLKRHWRMSDDTQTDGEAAAKRSREIVTREVMDPLREKYDKEVVEAIEAEFQKAVYGDKGDQRSNRQPLLLGMREINYLAAEARKIAEEHKGDKAAAKKAAEEWKKNSNANMKAMRDGATLPGGLTAAMFGRMITSDVEANIDAAIHVAHAFTVHEAESESDYFTVVDDLHRVEDDAGADHIGETELTSGLFYGYVVVDRKTLLDNLGEDASLAGEVTERLVHLVATVSPGAKLGSTAPYGFASWLLVEAGKRQPRSLAEAFRKARKPETSDAEQAASEYIASLDKNYGAGEVRRLMSLSGTEMPEAEVCTLDQLAAWAGEKVRTGEA